MESWDFSHLLPIFVTNCCECCRRSNLFTLQCFCIDKGEYITLKDTFIFLRSEICYTLNVKHLRNDIQLLSDWIDTSGVSWRVRSN